MIAFDEKGIALNTELEELLEELSAYRADMLARHYPFQRSSAIITVWEMKKVTKRDFLEEAEKEKKELEESYKESVRQANERKE